MRSLFVKIFLWFWAASLLIIASTLLLVSLLEPYKPVKEDGRHIRRLAHFGRLAVEILERDGPDALHDLTLHKRRGPSRHIFLFDKNGTLLTREKPSADVKKLANQAGKSGVTEFKRSKKNILISQTVYGSGDKHYIMVGELPRPPHPPALGRFLDSRFLSLRFLAIFIVASIFCYWLAWYIASPARKLRKAARQFASGDLKTRVGPDLKGRKDELADLGHDFDLMAERIESLITSQGRLLRDISHELRSPLARLNVALELARSRTGSEREAALDRIERESERLNTLIGQLRTLTLLESGSESMSQKNLDLSSLVKGISDDADFEAGGRNCSVKVSMEESIIVKGSEELLRRAIENVVRNAVSYTEEGTNVEISLHVRKDMDKNIAVLEVLDHGPGVPEETLAELFTPFYRITEARDRSSGGMGIGLAITDRSIRMHGGNVRAFNADGSGLIIRIEIPTI